MLTRVELAFCEGQLRVDCAYGSPHPRSPTIGSLDAYNLIKKKNLASGKLSDIGISNG